MKCSSMVKALALGMVLALASVGCKHAPKGLTPIPGQKPTVTGPGPGPFVDRGQAAPQDTGPKAVDLANTNGTHALPADLERFEGRPANREIFKAFTVYFDFDRSEVKASEKNKVEAVANHLKNSPAGHDLVIEGHCDERGTEEYNRALGERRALSVREYLIRLGIGAGRIRTLSFGEDKPADPEHNEAAWAKNRRGEFLLLLPKP